MGNIKDKVDYLKTTKTLIKSALVTSGAAITDDTPFREYASFIQGLVPTGQENTEDVLRIQNLIHVHIYGGKIKTATEIAAEYALFNTIGTLHMSS